MAKRKTVESKEWSEQFSWRSVMLDPKGYWFVRQIMRRHSKERDYPVQNQRGVTEHARYRQVGLERAEVPFWDRSGTNLQVRCMHKVLPSSLYLPRANILHPVVLSGFSNVPHWTIWGEGSLVQGPCPSFPLLFWWINGEEFRKADCHKDLYARLRSLDCFTAHLVWSLSWWYLLIIEFIRVIEGWGDCSWKTHNQDAPSEKRDMPCKSLLFRPKHLLKEE